MFPPTSVLRPPAAITSPARVVVRGLTVRTSDGDDVALQKAGRKFHFADHRIAKFASGVELRDVVGNSRAHNDQVLIAEGSLAMLAGFDTDAASRSCGISSRSCSWALASETATLAPRCARNKALATPDFPRPTTSTR